MKKLYGYWVDENNNRWYYGIYTEEQAEKYSGSLIGCSGCRDCSYCNAYQINPMRYTTGKIGSRKDNTTFYYLDGNLQVVCGCFRGDLEKFKEAVLTTHKDNEEYRNEYLKEIEKVKALFELEDGK